MLRPLFILLSCLAFYASTHADDDIKSVNFNRHDIKAISVVAPEWEGFTNKDGSGLYWELLRAIYEPVGITVKTANVPWNRAMKMVTKYSVYNAIVGEDQDTEESVLFTDFAIDVEYSSVLSMASRHLDWDGPQSLSGKNVAWMKDYDLISEEDRDFNLIEYRTVTQGLEMLEDGRIDFMIEEWDEIAEAVAANNQLMTRYDMNEMPEGKDVFVVFANSQQSQLLIDIYNERIPVLYQQGKLLPLYKKWEADLPDSVLQALEK